VLHRLLAQRGSEGTALPAAEPQRAMLERLSAADPGFVLDGWRTAMGVAS
jgi:hypothetical protein